MHYDFIFRIATEQPDLVIRSSNNPNDEQVDYEINSENKDLVMNFEEEVYNELENKLKEKHDINEKIITDAIVAAANEDVDDEKIPDEEAIHFVELNPNNFEKNFRSSFDILIAPESNQNVTYF